MSACRDQTPARDLRRHEAARGHRPGAGDGAEDAADGRALRRAGRADARQAAGRAAEDRRHHRRHGDDGDARRRRSRAAERPHRDADQRPGRHHRRGAARRPGPARATGSSWSRTAPTCSTARRSSTSSTCATAMWKGPPDGRRHARHLHPRRRSLGARRRGQPAWCWAAPGTARPRASACTAAQMCFGRGEGLPGQAWEAGRPIVLKQFEGSAFRRTQAAHADGLTCGIALPVFDGDALRAVVLIFCGDSARAGRRHRAVVQPTRRDRRT